VPALVEALSDRDRFVRWAAARTLGRIGPAARPEPATLGLAKLLSDPDLDVRMAAATTLEVYGPRAAKAIPAVVAATQTGDAEIRQAAMRALPSIDTKGQPDTIGALIKALANPDARVRQTAAETLGKFGSAARSARPALAEALNDDDPEVRRAASEALVDIPER
jgi:HEAT repeat protein